MAGAAPGVLGACWMAFGNETGTLGRAPGGPAGAPGIGRTTTEDGGFTETGTTGARGIGKPKRALGGGGGGSTENSRGRGGKKITGGGGGGAHPGPGQIKIG